MRTDPHAHAFLPQIGHWTPHLVVNQDGSMMAGYHLAGLAAELAGAFGHGVGHGEDLVGLLVEQEMEVAEVRPGHVPVEVLGLKVEREGVGEERGERAGRIGHGDQDVTRRANATDDSKISSLS